MKTTSLIGQRCTHSNVFSRLVLITRGLDLNHADSRLAPSLTIVQFSGRSPESVGGYYSGGPPVPIPNTEVKPDCAEDTCLETDRENRSLPTLGSAMRSPGYMPL